MAALDCKVYIGDLPRDASEADLDQSFSYFGPINKIWVAKNPPGFAFVEFRDPNDAKDAIAAMNGKKICGCVVKVELSSGKKRTQPRPLLPNTTNAKGEKCYTLQTSKSFCGRNEFDDDERERSRRRSKSSHRSSSSTRSRDACYYCRHYDCRCSPISDRYRSSRRYSSRSSHSSGHSRRYRSRTQSTDYYDSDCDCKYKSSSRKSCKYCYERKYSRSRSRSYGHSKSRSPSHSSERHRYRSRRYSRSSSASSDESLIRNNKRSKRTWSRSVSREKNGLNELTPDKEKR